MNDEVVGRGDTVEQMNSNPLETEKDDEGYDPILSKLKAEEEAEVKKTSKIITNEKGDENEFSYFKKDKPKAALKPKL